MIHLDTSFLIPAVRLNTPESRRLDVWVGDGEAIVISAVAWTEFLCGPLSRSDLNSALRIAERYLEFTAEHSAIAARLFNATGRRRRMMVDCMIAAVAIADDAPLATANSGDFGRFTEHGLLLA